MRRAIAICVGLLAAATAACTIAASSSRQTSRVVDRIVARIEGDIILESQVRELGAFQKLVKDRTESDGHLLAEMIEQWMVQTEAMEMHFPEPAKSEVDREMARLTAHFPSPTAYSAKLNEVGLSAAQVRQLLTRQIYIERYLDYKFRPSVLIESSDMDAYYQKELLPELARKNQPAPARAEVEDQIRELLVQRGINALAAKWLDETKTHLKIQLVSPGSKP